MQIKSLKIPDTLVQAIEDGRWTRRGKRTSGTWMNEADIKCFRSVFAKCHKKPLPQLYGFEGIERENRHWHSRDKWIEYYLGRSDAGYLPGDIDPDRSIIIGSSEPECPIVLDYRSGEDNPSVAYMFYENGYSYWETAADNIDQLIKKLKL